MRAKTLLKRAATHLPYSRSLDSAWRMPLLQAWIDENLPHAVFETREQLYEDVHAEIPALTPLTYLEFGVHRGASIRRWVTMNAHLGSRFVGFDSFEGLPEAWSYGSQTLQKGHFDTGGLPPDITDPRVSFVKGWFQHSLPPFLDTFRPSGQLVIHCDADLYSSTLFVLCSMHPHLTPGTIVLFDDFCSTLDEFRALCDYSAAFMRSYKVLGAAHGRTYYKHAAIQFT